jgi:hypothetical protein
MLVRSTHFTAVLSAGIVQDRPDNHLLAVGPMILAVSELAEGLSVFALEVDGGRIEENQFQTGEQVAMPSKHCLLDKVLRAPNLKWCGTRLVRQNLAEKGHGPIHLVQGDIFDTSDGVVTTPLVARSVGTRLTESMQHREKYGALHVKCKLPAGKQLNKNRLLGRVHSFA